MTAEVHFFTFAGLTVAPVVGGDRYSTDSIQHLKEPVLGRGKLDATTADSIATEYSASPIGALVAYVQVEPGKTVHYEITTDNMSDLAPATEESRYATGNFTLQWGTGWRLSVREKSA